MSDTVLDAELWIGSPSVPIKRSKIQVSAPRLNMWEGLSMEELQIAGLHCHHQTFFGFKFKVPSTDPLAVVGHKYLGTHLPGSWNPEFSTPYSEIDKARNQLSVLGLELEESEKEKLAEAYIPITSESAWDYAQSSKLPVFLHPHEHALVTVPSVEEFGLDGTWQQASTYLASSWEKLRKDYLDENYDASMPKTWSAILHYPNWD